MTFKIVSTGWSCKDWIQQTLRSIERQTVDDYVVQIVYDGGDGGEDVIQHWCDNRDSRWRYMINENQMYAPHNQFKALELLQLEDDDIVVFLDLDGDMFAHHKVLEHLIGYYIDGFPLVTYGNYKPIPYTVPPPPVLPFPDDVVAANSYRSFILYGGMCSFNHLRTMRGVIAKAIDPVTAKWPDGRWHISGGDYLIMVSALELAGGRYRVIEEVLLHYNNANPKADNLMHPDETTECNAKFLREPQLTPLTT